jgi:hypothetical protein
MTTADAKVELVARALCELQIRQNRKWDTQPDRLEEMLPAAVDYAWRSFIDEARAAITALEALHSMTEAITDEMIEAGVAAWRDPSGFYDCSDAVREIYTAMQAARPIDQQEFQTRVSLWMDECFTPGIKADRLELCDRFIEESLELVQTEPSFTVDRAHALVDYVFGRAVGEADQEVGGVLVTLAALCGPFGINMAEAGEREVARISTPETIAKIRAKQAAKPTGSALPIAPVQDDDAEKAK